MQVWQAALWGMAGGFSGELWNLHKLTRQPAFSWRRPIPQGLSAWVTAALARVLIGTIVVAAASAGDEIRGAWVAFTLGIAAPLVVQKLAGEVPLAGGEDPAGLAPGGIREDRVVTAKERQPVAGSGDGDGDPR
jgi:hypothetical protein